VHDLAAALLWFDYLGLAVFAATGALAAARLRHDLVTFVAFAILTGIGGGTLRDLLIGAPVFWVHSGQYLLVCVGMAGAVWIVGERPWRNSALLWLDAVGLTAYATIGAAKGLTYDVVSPVAVTMGVLTATFGGILRDVLAGEPSVLLRREIYITAALLSATIYVAAHSLGVDPIFAGVGAFVAGFALRAGAIMFGWRLPGFDSRG
jgi:uncharacterized membrane protein YeiH